jgi:hypothetical protein
MRQETSPIPVDRRVSAAAKFDLRAHISEQPWRGYISVENGAKRTVFVWTDFQSMPIRMQQVWNSAYSQVRYSKRSQLASGLRLAAAQREGTA